MQDEIKKIELVCENCEVITLEGKHIGDLDIDNIKSSIERIACNSIREINSCDSFSISIHRDADNINRDETWIFGNTDGDRSPLNRLLKYNDITSVCVYFTDKTKLPKDIYVPWNDEDDYSNTYQKAYINNFGDLFIVIDKNKLLEDIFKAEEMNNEKYMESTWFMYK